MNLKIFFKYAKRFSKATPKTTPPFYITFLPYVDCFDIREHSHMASDVWVGRYVKLHLVISDVGRWVGQRESDVRSAIFEFLLFRLFLD